MDKSRVTRGGVELIRHVFLVTFATASVVNLHLGHLLGQEVSSSTGEDSSQVSVQALRQIDRDYADFLNKRTRIVDSYAQVQKSLRESEQDLQRIGNEAIRQQMAAFQARLQSMKMDAMLNESRRRADGQDNPGGPRPTSQLATQRIDMKVMTQRALAVGKTGAEFQFALRESELNQLDATSQAVVRARLDNFRRANQLEGELVQWVADWPKFMDRYWPYTDFERSWSLNRIQETLKELNLANQENLAAKLATARLKCRIGLADEALGLVDEVIEQETPLTIVATAIKAEILTVQGEEKKAKAALQAALRIDAENAYVRWIRAELLLDQKQFALAEPLLKGFMKNRDFELPARKRLALLYFNRSLDVKGKRAEADAIKALKEAEVAWQLEAKPSWHTELIYALAQYRVGDSEASLKQVAKASEKATDTSLDLCREWEQKMKDGEVEPWLFLTTFGEK